MERVDPVQSLRPQNCLLLCPQCKIAELFGTVSQDVKSLQCFPVIVSVYEISEVLDARTCKFCAAMNGLKFTWDKYEVGITAPSFHPCCRGRVIPVERTVNKG